MCNYQVFKTTCSQTFPGQIPHSLRGMANEGLKHTQIGYDKCNLPHSYTLFCSRICMSTVSSSEMPRTKIFKEKLSLLDLFSIRKSTLRVIESQKEDGRETGLKEFKTGHSKCGSDWNWVKLLT